MRTREWHTATSSFILSSSWPRCTSWWPSLTGSGWSGTACYLEDFENKYISCCNCCCPFEAMSQQCWRPPSPTAAGLPSGWRCRPAGPVWSSTSGCCSVRCAAVRMNPDRVVPASNVARHPAATSASVFDRKGGQPGRWEAGMTATRRQMTQSSPRCSEWGPFCEWRSMELGVKDSKLWEVD